MICLFSFPRSGSDWITACLNSVQGISIAEEPFYGMRHQPETEVLESLHPEFYDGVGSYRGDYMQPKPSDLMRAELPAVAKTWVVNAPAFGANGFKEVYMCHKIPLLLDGLRAAGAKPRVLHLWRHFPGMCSSYETRGIYWWVIKSFTTQRDRSVGTPVEPIYYLFEPETKPQMLFLIWLAAVYRDRMDVEAAGGMVVCYDDLMGGGPATVDLWNRMFRYVGYLGEPFAFVRYDHETLTRVGDQTAAFSEAHRDELDWMYLEAARMTDSGAVGRPEILMDILEGSPSVAAGPSADVAAQAERVE